MANITASLVKDLREKTGAGMMDCKTALGETGGDMEAAVDWLRKKGLAKAAKKSGRIAAEGLIAVATREKAAVAVEVNSETDFVARNEQFQAFAREVATLALATDGTLQSLETARMPGSGAVVKDRLQELIATVGENMSIRRVQKLQVGEGAVASYVHGAVKEGLGRIGVLVALESKGDSEKLSALGRQIAMHIAAMSPIAVDSSGIDPTVLEREKAILAEKHQGKPSHVLEKIVESGLKTYYKEVTLLEQPFVHDPSKSVGQILKEAASSVGTPIAVGGFVRFQLGEGVEKQGSDFAAEVAAAAGQR